jgi:hypothetical protein
MSAKSGGSLPLRRLNDIFACALDGICYVNFECYDGAMDTEQCVRLWDIIRRARTFLSRGDAIVLTERCALPLSAI